MAPLEGLSFGLAETGEIEPIQADPGRMEVGRVTWARGQNRLQDVNLMQPPEHQQTANEGGIRYLSL